MIPQQEARVVTSGGVAASAPFGISSQDTAHIMGILREGLYSDRVLAVLREYSANAWDAHNESGKGTVPILVTLPMDEDPNLRIRDYGPGLSVDEVLTVYNQYGRSSKRGTNLAVGQLGIGSKSAFCYSDSFTITSYHGGKKRIFIAVIDASNLGKIDLVHEEDSEELGIEIQIAVKPGDISEFHQKARNLFRHFKVRPEINIDLPPPPPKRAELVHGNLRSAHEAGAGWLAIMGCVPYRVNTGQIDSDQVGEHLSKIAGELYFGIGEVEMSANREELKYTNHTKAALVEKLNALVDEYIAQTMGTIESSEFTPWEKRLRAQILNQLELPIPKQWKEITDHSIKIEYLGLDFTLIHNKAPSTRISVESGTRILIDDTNKELIGYHLQFSDWVMRPAEGQTVQWARDRLDEALAKSGLTGINIQLLSTIPWTAPYRKPKKVTNPKHKVTTFKLNANGVFKSPYSDLWTVERRVPTKEDVFVVIRNFKAENYKNFFSEYRDDQKLAKHCGGTMPDVYGYKSTLKKPVDLGALMGMPYQVWRQHLAQKLSTVENLELIDAMHWQSMENTDYVSSPGKHALFSLTKSLGEYHPIIELFTKQALGARSLDGCSSSKREALSDLANRLGKKHRKSDAYSEVERIRVAYPLLKISGISSLWSSNSKEWVDYVHMVDKFNSQIIAPNIPLHADGSIVQPQHDGVPQPPLNGHTATTFPTVDSSMDGPEYDF